jgi:hypothetical protein
VEGEFSEVSAERLRVALFLAGKLTGKASSKEGAMPRELERHLVVERIPAQMLASVLTGEQPGRFPLDQGVVAEYSEWELVSHTFDVRDDDTALLTVIFETRARRAAR